VTLHRRSLPSEISRHLALSQEHRHTTTWLPVGAPPKKNKQTDKQQTHKHIQLGIIFPSRDFTQRLWIKRYCN
jgi:hypothetical protein